MRIESIENLIQLAVLGICFIISAQHYYASRLHAWAMMFLATFVYFLGDLYWQLYLIFFGVTPYYSHIPYLSWYASYLFLILLIASLRGEDRKKVHSSLMFLIPVFTSCMAFFYMLKGDYISNVVCAIIMGVLIWQATEGLVMAGKEGREKAGGLYIAILALCAAEYASWTCSFFWEEDIITNPYYLADTLLSLAFLMLPFALRKAVDR
jgi:hypothetical protein